MYFFFPKSLGFIPYNAWNPHAGHLPTHSLIHPTIYPSIHLFKYLPTARPCCGHDGSCHPAVHEQSEFTKDPLFSHPQILRLAGIPHSPSEIQALNSPAHFLFEREIPCHSDPVLLPALGTPER